MENLEELLEREKRLEAQIKVHRETLLLVKEQYESLYQERVKSDDYLLDLESYILELERDINLCKSLLESGKAKAELGIKAITKKGELKKQIKEDINKIEIAKAMKDKELDNWSQINRAVRTKLGELESAKYNLECHERKLEKVREAIKEQMGEVLSENE